MNNCSRGPERFPTTLRIGPINYHVELHDDLFVDASENGGSKERVCGLINVDGNTIKINRGFPEETQWHSLFHEISHAFLWHYMGIRTHDQDETSTDQLAGGLMELFRDNHVLLRSFLAFDYDDGLHNKTKVFEYEVCS